MQKIHVIYRISDKGYNKDKSKLDNATKKHCLMNAAEIFGRENFYVIADNCSPELVSFIRDEGFMFEETHGGNGPTFKRALTKAVSEYDDDDIAYLLEDDYLHLPGSLELIREGLAIADYVTLYDHPDQYEKYTLRRKGAAPLNRWNLLKTRVYLTEHSHWREIPSTTMTFAARVKTLKEDCRILMCQPDTGPTDDFGTFLKLTKRRSLIDAVNILQMPKRLAALIVMNNFALFRKKRKLIVCIPGRATHCETKWLSPLVDWTKI